MREIAAFHLPALERAVAELERGGGRYEAFARVGTVVEVRWSPGGGWEQRRMREAGVACRLYRDGAFSFAAAAGSAASAGREAAAAAVSALLPGDDRLPPHELLGRAPLPEAAGDVALEPTDEFGRRLLERYAEQRGTPPTGELRVVAGRATSTIHTADGFTARAAAGAAVVELLTAGGSVPRLFQAAARRLTDLDPEAVAERAAEAAALADRGTPPTRQLADVILAPAVAARLLAVAAAVLARPGHRIRSLLATVSPVWEVLDARSGPDGLALLPWDGEGLPSRSIPLITGGAVGEPLATFDEARRHGVSPGGAVRASYREPPLAAPANLVVRPNPALPAAELFHRLGDGFYLALPLGGVQLDQSSGRFSVACTALAIRQGRPHAGHPAVELRGSLARLMRNLEATGGDRESFSLSCAVTTPSLLVRGLEIA